MKQYIILDNQNIHIGSLQVDDAISIDQLRNTYGQVVESNQPFELPSMTAEQHARTFRNKLLSAVDQINGAWYASLALEQQTELQTYRQALLAVPQQAGFPLQVEWPAKPIWL
jgi:uncharacterized protein YaaN involved in tellurite resistance